MMRFLKRFFAGMILGILSGAILGFALFYFGIIKPIVVATIRYEVALGVMGIVVTAMTIFIAFEITFPAKYDKETFRFTSGIMITKLFLVIFGVWIILTLVDQAFSWQIDRTTNLISELNFNNLRLNIAFALLWIVIAVTVQFVNSYALFIKHYYDQMKRSDA